MYRERERFSLDTLSMDTGRKAGAHATDLTPSWSELNAHTAPARPLGQRQK